ncbi:MAG TPA: tRNA 5-methoxyuridine(34)/uridine 5-oxyacetic acid(34) synthase CmoB, partial [Idiomarina loihiensis]|nr:tRNA 5-methoxyuridine(34)/uridine 5-oxyacetic acid(34) synthase CmoB [Idiomarina loihiensis]
QMRNVWFLPSASALSVWLERLGFKDISVVDHNTTSIDEQRRTDWMTGESLADFLDPNDTNKTIEGYQAPIRAVITARV